MQTREFNLLRERWIRAMRPDCSVEECSLRELLLHAQDYVRLAGELPTQDVAILRLLLAVLHTVFGRVDERGEDFPLEDRDEALRRWKALWERGSFPETAIDAYLDAWVDRFWLFHETHPFYQVPEAEQGTEYTAAKLNGELSESSHKLRLFPLRAGDAKRVLTYAEAARWLLYVNAYDDTSAKPKQKGLPSPGAGWLGKLGLIYAQGGNLFETLMLNLVLVHDQSLCWEAPRPVWELDAPRSAERTEIELPDNQAELLTLQSRRLLLRRDGEGVVGYELLGGDFFSKINAVAEQMTVWAHVDARGKEPAYDQPRRHNPERQLWRDFSCIAGRTESGRIPGVVAWVGLLRRARLLSRKDVICFRTAALQYGDKDFFVTDVFGDHLDFHTELLTEQASDWIELIQRQINLCEEAAGVIGRLADGLCKAAGGARASEAQHAKEQFFGRIDVPFRKWLLSIAPEVDSSDEARQAKEDAWRQEAYEIARRLGRELVDQAGNAAFVGRWLKEGPRGKEKTNFYSSPSAYASFGYFLKKCFGIGAVKEELHA